MCEEDLDLECGIGGGICGPARGKRFAVRGHGEGRDGKEHEALMIAQRGHDGPLRAFPAHRNRLAVAARAEGLDSGVHRFRTIFKAQQLTVCSASGLEADLVLRLRPVEANKGRTGCGCLWLQVCSPSV